MSHHLKTLPKCEAKTRSDKPCQQIAMANGRCYLHGGKSTGPRTQEGLLRMKESKTKHGRYSKERIEEKRAFHMQLQQTKKQLEGILQSL
jgi:hypothetical protein